MEQIKFIDTKNVNWDKLSFAQFKQIEATLQQTAKLTKESRKVPRKTGYIIAELQGKKYKLKIIDYERLKNIRSPKSKEKFINKIILTHNPINEI